MFEQWIVPDNKIKCYSYIRWSSDQQATGTTLARQLQTAREIADENKLELVELIDAGVSAFKGKNVKQGPLADFIDAVRNKVIPENSWLVVENLDRLSREDIFKAQRLFMEMLELGVTVVTGMDRRAYSSDSIKENPLELMYSIMLFARAHEESETKSQRTYGNALAIVRKHQAGERSPEGYAYAIESVGRNMWWSDCSDGTVRPHPVYYEVAKKIVELILNGWGSYRLVGYLNDNYPVPTQNNRNSWSHNLVANFHKRRALFGEKAIKIAGVQYVLSDYYPALIDEDTFYKLAHIKKDKISKSTATRFQSFVSGLNILKCGVCGGNMYSNTQRKKNLRYICGTGQTNRGCRAWSFAATWIEDTLLRLAANHVFRPIGLSQNFDVEERALEEKIRDKEQQLERLLDVITEGNAPPSIVKRINAIEQDIEQAKRDIELTAIKKHYQTQETVEWDVVDERALDFSENDIRESLKLRVSNGVTKIECFQVKAKHIFFVITFINGKTIMAHRTPSTLAFDGGAWVKLGDHFGKKVPVYDSENAVLGLDDNDDTETSLYENVTQGIQQTEKGDSLDELLAKHAIDPTEISGYDGYKYTGLYNVSVEMVEAYENGKAPKELEADILRVQHLIEWADGLKNTPTIIEDQYQVYKHPSAKKVLKKEVAEILYVDGAKFVSEVVPAWQRKLVK